MLWFNSNAYNGCGLKVEWCEGRTGGGGWQGGRLQDELLQTSNTWKKVRRNAITTNRKILLLAHKTETDPLIQVNLNSFSLVRTPFRSQVQQCRCVKSSHRNRPGMEGDVRCDHQGLTSNVGHVIKYRYVGQRHVGLFYFYKSSLSRWAFSSLQEFSTNPCWKPSKLKPEWLDTCS